MNTITLPRWYDTLEARLQEFYMEPPGGPGNVQLVVYGDAPEEKWTFIAVLGKQDIQLVPEADAGDLAHHAGLAMREEVLHRMLEQPDDLDPRSEYFGRNTVVGGDMGLMQYFVQLLKRPSQYDQKLFQHAMTHPHQAEVIYEVAKLDMAALVEAVVNNQPVVVRGAFDWPAIRWSMADFTSIMGGIVARFNAKTQKEDTLADIVEEMQVDDKKRVYTAGRSLPESAYKHFEVPAAVAELAGKPHIWLGKSQKGRLISKLHADVYTSFLAQVWGVKTVYLYPPAEYERLTPLLAYCGYLPFYFDPLNPDYARYPKAEGLEPFRVDIGPGDMLVIPTGWVHAVEVDGWTLSISRAVRLEEAYAWWDAHGDHVTADVAV